MNVKFEDVGHQGIRNITPEDVAVAQELGYVVKLVGSIEETASGIAAEVTPTFLPKTHPLASVNGVMNAVFVGIYRYRRVYVLRTRCRSKTNCNKCCG